MGSSLAAGAVARSPYCGEAAAADLLDEQVAIAQLVAAPQTTAAPVLALELPELCSNECDDDNDDLVDCADPNCGCECPDDALEATLDEPVGGSTDGGNDFGAGSCGGGGAPDTGLAWTPPRTGRYHVSTEGSAFDAVLYVQEGDVCGGTELGCNDDTAGAQSQVGLGLTAGQTVIIIVDGFYDDRGSLH